MCLIHKWCLLYKYHIPYQSFYSKCITRHRNEVKKIWEKTPHLTNWFGDFTCEENQKKFIFSCDTRSYKRTFSIKGKWRHYFVESNIYLKLSVLVKLFFRSLLYIHLIYSVFLWLWSLGLDYFHYFKIL